MGARKGGPRYAALVVVLGLALVASACGGDDDDADAGGTSTSAGGSTATTAAAVREGGSITYGMFGDLKGFDPIVADYLPALGGNAALAIYDSLMRFTADDSVEPHLAESLSSTDQKVWTLKLRSGVTFTDGTALDADAVVLNIERHRNPANKSVGAGIVAGIASLRAVDDLTVEITLTGANAGFPAALAVQPGYIASPAALTAEGAGYSAKPVGAGPFMLDEWVPGDHITLVRNPEYWQDGLPHLDEITYRPYADATTRSNALRSGEADVVYMISAAELAEARDTDGLEVTAALGNGGAAVVYNASAPPFDDLRLRRAVAMSLNYDALSATFYDGHLIRATSLFVEDSPWYTDVSADVPNFDLAGAKKLVSEYESATGRQAAVTLMTTSAADGVARGEFFQQMMEAAGFDVTLAQHDVSEFVTRIFGKQYEMALTTYPHFGEPTDYFVRNFSTTSPQNIFGVGTPTLDQALERGRSGATVADRQKAYDEVNTYLAKQSYPLVYAAAEQALVSNGKLVGIDMNRDGTLFPATLSVKA